MDAECQALVINSSMRLSEILKADVTGVWSVRGTDQWVEEGDPDEYEDDISVWRYDIMYNGQVVGELTEDNFFGHMQADFGARTVEISKYRKGHLPGWEAEDADERVPHILGAVENYFASPKGQQHFEIMARQQGLETKIDEIKVTKTVAGKKQTPSRNLAMDQKKKSPKQGKKPVELDKTVKSMKDLSNEILKGEYTHTRDFGK